ncbi:MAG: hypothetical protein NTY38_08600 [Acidobacteria bacterium]|nr:hypothetical protein [Acidobacteriota bacterium]
MGAQRPHQQKLPLRPDHVLGGEHAGHFAAAGALGDIQEHLRSEAPVGEEQGADAGARNQQHQDEQEQEKALHSCNESR